MECQYLIFCFFFFYFVHFRKKNKNKKTKQINKKIKMSSAEIFTQGAILSVIGLTFHNVLL